MRLRGVQKRAVPRQLQLRSIRTAAIRRDAVTDVELAPGAVTTVALSTAVATSISDAVADAADAQLDAAAAQLTADGKNKVFRQTSAPTATASGDLWFDTDDDNRIYRWDGASWVANSLGNNALASISASKITAGTIDASVITVSNLNAGNISVGNLAAARIATTALNADNITAGTITGREINNGSGTFLVTAAGAVTAASVTITGGTIAIGPNFEVDSFGTMISRATTLSTATTIYGALTIFNGAIFAGAGNEYEFYGALDVYGQARVYSPGIAYYGSTAGPGSFNNIGFSWNNPDLRGIVDNVAHFVVGTLSDVRSKMNIVDAPKEWETLSLNSLRVVEYNPVDLLDDENLHLYPKRLGLIAQELKNVFPYLVTSANDNDEDAFLSVNYAGLVPHLIQMVQSLSLQIADINERMDA